MCSTVDVVIIAAVVASIEAAELMKLDHGANITECLCSRLKYMYYQFGNGMLGKGIAHDSCCDSYDGST